MNLVYTTISIFPFIDFNLILVLVSPTICLMSSAISVNPSMKLVNNSIIISISFCLMLFSIISPYSSISAIIFIAGVDFNISLLTLTLRLICLSTLWYNNRLINRLWSRRKRIGIYLRLFRWRSLFLGNIRCLRNLMLTSNTMGTYNWKE